ncbi:hypothetical protein PTSG_10937 [Salpingoeca rosetta]|uniref:Uncharacterized protein n=1 Tax=Salpingoeca rosetta (strain ATCC 50818 / BSB-021) TaxID=946362 RepID=F2URF9_SALR5|nr:uncharacterized protein PTSG_10937 [Salpingoeca rosetta]EGD80262.1 hypothetical protein PTSG_10937 [Salpingoeca rosetta]|eukprot:XP_004988324.1 hypothetical protein PTSG_10937 [Salpingoeca rosetta]
MDACAMLPANANVLIVSAACATSKMHSAGHWQLRLGFGGVVINNGLIHGIPPFDTTPATSVPIISPSTTATAVTIATAVTAAVVDTTTINSLQTD